MLDGLDGMAAFKKTPGRRPAIGIVVPHAGYVYSGQVAGSVYSRLIIPNRTIILCPNHTGMGAPMAIMSKGAWRTPLGDIQIDAEMSSALMALDPAIEEDALAHEREHSLEVQLPFLQYLKGAGVMFVPITVGTSDWSDLENLGRAIAHAVQQVDSSTLIIASSDMNHYESDAITRIKDAKAIDPLLKRDARNLYETVQRNRISMCGFAPVTAMLIAANLLGATEAELVNYATSAEVSGDFDRVVGYAGIGIWGQ
jgi:MEMO1 family protein